MKVWRHLYTRAAAEESGAPEFRTVACASPLDPSARRGLEMLTGSAARSVAGLSAPRRCRLLQPSPTDVDRCVLSQAQPLAPSFDGRPGNCWVESLVVPHGWLERLGWDLPVAFGALDWWGPERGQAEARRSRGTPASLPEEDLPAVGPGDPARRVRLAKLVPDQKLRRGLLAAFAQQAQESADPAPPIYVVAAADDELGELEELLLLLPLAFPPDLRRRADADGRPRCLRLATLGGEKAVPSPDLAGVRPSGLDDLRGGPGHVFDLAGGVPPPMPDGEAMRLASRIDGSLTGGDPRRIAALHEDRRPVEPRPAERTTMTVKRNPPPRGPGDGGSAAGAVLGTDDHLEARESGWARREAAEAAAGSALSALAAERDGLADDLAEVVRAQREKLQQDADRLTQELRDAGIDESNALAKVARQAQSDLRRAFQSKERELKSSLDGWLDDRIRHLDAEQREIKEALDRRFEEAREALETRRTRALHEIGDAGGLPPEDDDKPRKKRFSIGGAAVAGRRLLGRRSVWIGLTVVLVLVITAVGWNQWTSDNGEPEVNGRPTLGRGEESPFQTGDRAPALDVLDGALAQALLGRALEQPELRRRAAQAWVLVALDGGDPALGADESCTLVQTLVRQRLVALAEDPIPVDGSCGPGTQSVVRAAAAATGCGDRSWEAEAACLVVRELVRDAEACTASWPFRLGCPWTVERAERLLALARVAAQWGAAGQVLRRQVDLLANPQLAAAVPERWDDEDRREFLPLAGLLAQAGFGGVPDGAPWNTDLSRRELELTRDYLDDLSATAGEEAREPPGGGPAAAPPAGAAGP